MIYQAMAAVDAVCRERRFPHAPLSIGGAVQCWSPDVQVVAFGPALWSAFMDDGYPNVRDEMATTAAYPGPREYHRVSNLRILFAFDHNIKGDDVWLFITTPDGLGRWERPQPRRQPTTPEPTR